MQEASRKHLLQDGLARAVSITHTSPFDLLCKARSQMNAKVPPTLGLQGEAVALQGKGM